MIGAGTGQDTSAGRSMIRCSPGVHTAGRRPRPCPRRHACFSCATRRRKVPVRPAAVAQGLHDALRDDPIDLLVVDGPPAHAASHGLARYPALPLLADRLAPGGTVVPDDAERPGQQEVLRRWERETGLGFDRGAERGVWRWPGCPLKAPGPAMADRPSTNVQPRTVARVIGALEGGGAVRRAAVRGFRHVSVCRGRDRWGDRTRGAFRCTRRCMTGCHGHQMGT